MGALDIPSNDGAKEMWIRIQRDGQIESMKGDLLCCI